jgi:AcrR family transcriptional regulator
MAKSSVSPQRLPAKRAHAQRTAEHPRDTRQRVLVDARRALVLDAARAAFFELGLEKTSIREIAKRAGYTPGAIYSYFSSKEEVYAALLGESLNRLNGRVDTARAECTEPGAALLMATAKSFFEFYRENPRDLDLGFYLFQGMQPRGLTPALNETLNGRLRDALRPTQDALETLGMPPGDALAEVTALFAHIVGLLMLSHTGRIRMFKQASQELFDRYLDRLVAMAAAPQKAGRSKRGRN